MNDQQPLVVLLAGIGGWQLLWAATFALLLLLLGLTAWQLLRALRD